MDKNKIEGVILEKKSIIDLDDGSILHILDSSEDAFENFGDPPMLICQLTCCSSWAMLNEQLNQRDSNFGVMFKTGSCSKQDPSCFFVFCPNQ